MDNINRMIEIIKGSVNVSLIFIENFVSWTKDVVIESVVYVNNLYTKPKPLNGLKIVVIDKIQIFKSNDRDLNCTSTFGALAARSVPGTSTFGALAAQDSNIKEYEHFQNWLNYLFKLSTTKPNSKSNINFEDLEYISITYTYNNNTYKLNIVDDFTDQQKVSINNSNLRRGILEADIKSPYNLYHEIDITKRLREYLGPNHDFCINFNNSSNLLDYMFPELYLKEWENLHILDSFGKNHNIDLKNNNTIDWDPNFSL